MNRLKIISIASIHHATKASQLKNLLVIFLGFKQVKNSFRRNSVTDRAPCHAIGHFAFWCYHVTYRTSCHASGHLVIYRKCYGFKKAFFTLTRFLPYTPFCWFSDFPGSRQFNLKIQQGFMLIFETQPRPQESYTDRFYLRVMASRLTIRIYPLRDLNYFSIKRVCQKPHTLSVRPQSHKDQEKLKLHIGVLKVLN